MTEPTFVDVPVRGGDLRVARWGPATGAPVVLGFHGITANHLNFVRLARELGPDVTVVAPDLRGRGGSGSLPPPFGITAHVADAVAALDHLGIDRATVVGHSMGGWVAGLFAAEHPDRTAGLVIVDGGAALPGSEDVPIDDLIQAVLGPSVARLSMTFESVDAYLDFWRAHPSVGGRYWSDDFERYLAYDLVGDPPALRSSVSAQAVRDDSVEELTVPEVRDALDRVTTPFVFVRPERGILDGDRLYPDAVMPALTARWPAFVELVDVPDTNHFTLLVGDGAPHVAAVVRKVLG